MTTVDAPNVLNLAVRGTFDDCQDLVKAMFADAPFRQELRLSAVNSINWARVVAQAVYYVWAALRLGAPGAAGRVLRADRQFRQRLCRPGRRGDRAAGRAAGVATNENDILARFFATGRYARGTVVPRPPARPWTSRSRAISSACCSSWRAATPSARAAGCRPSRRAAASRWTAPLPGLFAGGSADQAEVAATIAATLRATGELVDPHTARRPRGRRRAIGRRRACRW